MRVGAWHDCPAFANSLWTLACAAAATSAPGSTILADFPPSSWCTRLTVSAAALATSTPARVEPVNDTISISGCEAMACPTVGPSPLTRLNTPRGIRIVQHLGQHQGRQRRDLAGLQHDRAPGGERIGELRRNQAQ